MSARLFVLERDIDESGVSGTGQVAEGVCFSDGTAAMRWKTRYASTAVYASMEDLEKIHGHDGKTRIVWEERQVNLLSESISGPLNPPELTEKPTKTIVET